MDFQESNFGFRTNAQIIFLDGADIERYTIPEDLTLETITAFSNSICNIMYQADFSKMSYFRGGFIMAGGWLSQIVFSTMSNKGFSNSFYTQQNNGSFISSVYTSNGFFLLLCKNGSNSLLKGAQGRKQMIF